MGSRELAEMGSTLQSEHEDEDGEARAVKLRNKDNERIIINISLLVISKLAWRVVWVAFDGIGLHQCLHESFAALLEHNRAV